MADAGAGLLSIHVQAASGLPHSLADLIISTPPCNPLTPAGHEFDTPGVFATNPREAPGTVAWREAVPVGFTDMSQEEVHTLVQRMGQEYKGNRWG